MNKVKAKLSSIKQAFKTDPNLTNARRGIVRGVKALPGATGRYLIQKVPVVQWLPQYSPIWLVNDFIAGITVGFLLIPQALVFATLAGLPLQVGLFASWVPSVLYFFTGTTKDLSTGPTLITAVLTGQVISLLSGPPPGIPSTGAAAGVFPPMGASPSGTGVMPLPTGGAFPPSAAAVGTSPAGGLRAIPSLPPTLVAATVAFSVGILSLIVGALNLGWLFDLISIPVLIGFVQAAAIIIIQAQVPTILGEIGVSPIFLQQGPDIFAKIGTAQPLTIAIGASGIVTLVLLQLMGKKWGKENKAIWFLSISRNAIVLILFTGISFGVNKDLVKPVWGVVGNIPSDGLKDPMIPPAMLVSFIIFLSIPVFIGTALEHVATAKFFGNKNGYAIDQSQELVYLGLTNLINGVLGGMPVSGSLATSAINSETDVKSPLSGLFTSAFVLLGILVLNKTLFWIPQATLSAVVIVSVINILPPAALMGKYWKTSFIDFLASFFATQFTIVASSTQGLGLGIAFMVVYTIIRTTFARARPVTRADLESHFGADRSDGHQRNHIPSGTQVMTFSHAIIFMNANRIKRNIIDTVQTYHRGAPMMEQERARPRLWNELGEKRIKELRKRAKLAVPAKLIPRLQVLVLDFTQVNFIDTTGLDTLREVKADLLVYGGEDVELRFVGLNEALKRRFERAGWQLASADEALKGLGEGRDVVHELLKPAIEAQRMVRDSGLDFGFGNVLMSDSGSVYDMGDEEKGRVTVTQIGVKDGKAYKGS